MGIFSQLLFTAGGTGGPRRVTLSGASDLPASHGQPVRTILVASGDPQERQKWIDSLAHPQHRILAAEDGQAALRALEANAPDLLVAAVSMAKLDGLELLRMVRDIAPRVRVILIARGNRHVDRSYMKLAKLLGAAATFTQPVDGQTLLSGARTALNLNTSSG